MRGTLSQAGPCGQRRRIIPADAGNTSVPVSISSPAKDHPRGCGEHACRDSLGDGREGSSPRMRGTLLGDYTGDMAKRIIPADAGNTPTLGLSGWLREDHPRGCGEHRSCWCWCRWHWGSSPRMRGTRKILARCCSSGGIIPADAGNTWERLHDQARRPDHPRGCGEHMNDGELTKPALGSSPRMRGTRRLISRAANSIRIIPADAGNTLTPIPGCVPIWDHPRGCGEHRVWPYAQVLYAGSSPRMRGTHGIISCVS